MDGARLAVQFKCTGAGEGRLSLKVLVPGISVVMKSKRDFEWRLACERALQAFMAVEETGVGNIKPSVAFVSSVALNLSGHLEAKKPHAPGCRIVIRCWWLPSPEVVQ